MGTEKSIVLFESADGSVELPVMLDPECEDVWLSRTQLATLFGRDVKTIGKHVANALGGAYRVRESNCRKICDSSN